MTAVMDTDDAANQDTPATTFKMDQEEVDR